MPDNVRCRDCGFLAIRRNDASREMVEVEYGIRQDGKFPSEPLPARRNEGSLVTSRHLFFNPIPICFMMESGFLKDLEGPESDDSPQAKFTAIIGKARACDSYRAWIQGFSPREHREMAEQRWLAEWQKSRDEDDRRWREAQAAEDRKWRASEAELTRRAARIHILEIVLVIAVSIGSVVMSYFLTKMQIDAQRQQAPK